ncbi:MAG: hypothetical protein WDZ83_00345 [Rhizobiaceae bacterium]
MRILALLIVLACMYAGFSEKAGATPVSVDVYLVNESQLCTGGESAPFTDCTRISSNCSDAQTECMDDFLDLMTVTSDNIHLELKEGNNVVKRSDEKYQSFFAAVSDYAMKADVLQLKAALFVFHFGAPPPSELQIRRKNATYPRQKIKQSIGRRHVDWINAIFISPREASAFEFVVEGASYKLYIL